MKANTIPGGIIATLGLILIFITSSRQRLFSIVADINGSTNDIDLKVVDKAITYGPIVGIILLIIGIVIVVSALRQSPNNKQS